MLEIRSLLIILFGLAELLIFASVIVSWVPSLRFTPAGLWIRRTVEPFLRPFQQLVPARKTGGLDLSPLFALIALHIIRQIVLGAI